MQVEVPGQKSPDILLVEDDAGVRRSILMLLKAHGFRVKAYSLGSALISDAAAWPARLLIADWQIPDMDGFEILSSLRNKAWRGRAMMITGYDNQALVKKAISSGFEHVLRKPIVDHELIGAVTRILKLAANAESTK
ncbi:MAG: response regulator [Sphingomonadaceae bacterium]